MFVVNFLDAIKRYSEIPSWQYVPLALNSIDKVLCVVSAETLVESTKWLTWLIGAKFLCSLFVEWPQNLEKVQNFAT